MKLSVNQLRKIIKEEVVDAAGRFPRHNAMRDPSEDLLVMSVSAADAAMVALEDDLEYLLSRGSKIRVDQEEIKYIHNQVQRLVLKILKGEK